MSAASAAEVKFSKCESSVGTPGFRLLLLAKFPVESRNSDAILACKRAPKGMLLLMGETKEYPNGRCCVFQPFDKGGEFDRRFDDVLVPAITAAGMEPYRVDRDLGSTIPVDTLHQEIRTSAVCIADITSRNPNVMYELGYALALGIDVVIICGPSQERYPFDIQHRGILSYTVGAPSDFKQLERQLTDKLKVILERREKTDEIASSVPIRTSGGLLPHELTALALIFANSDATADPVAAARLKQEMSKAGFNEAATRLATARLSRAGYVKFDWVDGYADQRYGAYSITQNGDDWILENQSQLELSSSKSTKYADETTDEDIPF